MQNQNTVIYVDIVILLQVFVSRCTEVTCILWLSMKSYFGRCHVQRPNLVDRVKQSHHVRWWPCRLQNVKLNLFIRITGFFKKLLNNYEYREKKIIIFLEASLLRMVVSYRFLFLNVFYKPMHLMALKQPWVDSGILSTWMTCGVSSIPPYNTTRLRPFPGGNRAIPP